MKFNVGDLIICPLRKRYDWYSYSLVLEEYQLVHYLRGMPGQHGNYIFSNRVYTLYTAIFSEDE